MAVEAIESVETALFQVDPIINPRVRSYCRLPYPGHPRGCPNFGRRDICPPKAPHFEKIVDIDASVYCIVNKFDLKAHADVMRARHPDWSEAQIYCCLYWQGTARKHLRHKMQQFLSEHAGLTAIYVPEAHGVDVTATMASIGECLEWPPRNVAYQVALAGAARTTGRD